MPSESIASIGFFNALITVLIIDEISCEARKSARSLGNFGIPDTAAATVDDFALRLCGRDMSGKARRVDIGKFAFQTGKWNPRPL
jgi:hypothetical protein